MRFSEFIMEQRGHSLGTFVQGYSARFAVKPVELVRSIRSAVEKQMTSGSTPEVISRGVIGTLFPSTPAADRAAISFMCEGWRVQLLADVLREAGL